MANIVDILMKIQGDKVVFQSVANLSKEFQTLERNMQEQSGIARRLSSVWDGVGSKLAGVGGIIAGAFTVGAIVDFGKQTFELADNLVTLSEKTGQSTDTLQKLRYAAEQTGASTQGMDSALVKFNRTLGNSISSGKDKIFKDLGIDIKTASGEFKNADQIFAETVNKIGGLGSEAEQTAALMKVFGRSGAELLPTFQDGTAGLEKYGQELQNLGGILDAELIAKTEEAGDAINAADKAVKGFTQTIVLEAAPAIGIWAEGVTIAAKAVRTGFDEITKAQERTAMIANDESIQRAMKLWASLGVDDETIMARANAMADGLIKVKQQIAEIEVAAEKSKNVMQEWQGPLNQISVKAVEIADNFRIVGTEQGALLTNRSLQEMAKDSDALVASTAKLPENYRAIESWVDGSITLTNKYMDEIKGADAATEDNKQTTQEMIAVLQDQAAALDQNSKEYKKVTREIENMQRASEKAKSINAEMAAEIGKIGKAGAELEKIRFAEDFEKKQKEIAETGDIEEIEKFENQATEYKKKKIDEIEKKEIASDDKVAAHKIETVRETNAKIEQMTKQQQLDYAAANAEPYVNPMKIKRPSASSASGGGGQGSRSDATGGEISALDPFAAGNKLMPISMGAPIEAYIRSQGTRIDYENPLSGTKWSPKTAEQAAHNMWDAQRRALELLLNEKSEIKDQVFDDAGDISEYIKIAKQVNKALRSFNDANAKSNQELDELGKRMLEQFQQSGGAGISGGSRSFSGGNSTKNITINQNITTPDASSFSASAKQLQNQAKKWGSTL